MAPRSLRKFDIDGARSSRRRWHFHYFNQERSLYGWQNFKANRTAALAERRGLGAA